jgi:hypothetical protein
MFTETREVCFMQRNGPEGSVMNGQADFEYTTVIVDNDPRRQLRMLKKLTRQGWQVLAIRPSTVYSWASDTSEATLRRIRPEGLA